MPLNSSVRENGDVVISSGNSLTIENAAEFSRLLREALEAAHLVTLEFEPDVAVDITGVQVLCSACKSAAQGGKEFTCRGPQPQAMTDIIFSSGAGRHAACKHNNNSTCIWFGGA